MLKVLVIDADSNFASQLGRVILKQGHETRIVGDAKYGLIRAKAIEPDLVLVGNNVPGVTVPQLVADLRPFVPGRIVVCADSDDDDDAKAATEAGANDYLLKSSGIDAIVSKVCPKGEADVDGGTDDDSGEEGSEDTATKKKERVHTLRAPVKEGKRPFCVVVANTDEDKRAFITEIIERLNGAVHVMEVSTSEDAVTACAQNRTVMLVIDWEMPVVPTRQVMRSVRAGENGKSIALFVTYKSNSPEKQRVAMFEGALAFAHEPWDDGSLEGQLKHTLEEIRKRRRRAKIKALKAKAA